jgi:hypothetical protein
MIEYRCLSVLLGLTFGATFAVAQQMSQDPQRDVLYETARNKVGLLRYCKQQGLLDAKIADEAIEGAEEGVSAIAAFRETPVSQRNGDLAEKNGEAGLWGAWRSPMEQMAASLVRTPRELCIIWADEGATTRRRSAPTNRP